ncbi:MAG: hypothetical protein ACTSRZ_05955 [Promethearchaeota archaeon]
MSSQENSTSKENLISIDNIDNIRKKKEKIFKKILEIIREAEKALRDEIDPFKYNIKENLKKIAEIREESIDEDDILRGLKGYSKIEDVNLKQLDILEKLINKKIDIETKKKYKIIIDILNDKTKLLDFNKKFTRKLIQIRKIYNPIDFEIPFILPSNIHLKNMNQLKNIYRNLEEGKVKIIKEKDIELEIETDYLDENIYDEIMEILEIIKKEKELKILKFILTDSYAETLKRLQALAYLISHGYLRLAFSSEEEKVESGKYKIIYNNEKGDLIDQQENIVNDSKSIILGITYNEWKSLQPFLKNNNFENRPKINNID